MAMRKASIKETGEEISQAEWERFDAAVAKAKAEREGREPWQPELDLFQERRPSHLAVVSCGDRG